MIKTIQKIDTCLIPLWTLMGKLHCGVLLAIRLYMANIFFKSGVLKLKSLMNGQFEDVVTAFTDFHPIPFLPPTLAAGGAIFGEIILPIMLALGLFGRVGAAGLLLMAALIEFAVPAEYEISHPQHYMWMLLLAVPLFHGMGRASIDYWVAKWVRAQ